VRCEQTLTVPTRDDSDTAAAAAAAAAAVVARREAVRPVTTGCSNRPVWASLSRYRARCSARVWSRDRR